MIFKCIRTARELSIGYSEPQIRAWPTTVAYVVLTFQRNQIRALTK